MIVKNEEKFLPGCLESVKNIVDEIIIVDTGSTDKTIEIANSYNAKVFHLEWKGDFSQARNESIKHATGDWILILDADERLDPGQETKIKKYLNLNFDGLYVRIISADKNGNLSATEYPRLFRKINGIKFERKIHEQISPSILKLGGKLAKTDITITHLGYGQDDETMRKKYERNLQILLEELEENPDDA
ncbi:MAG: glycosyltransferase family 2 protein, partial [Candidatus Kryptonium sp.]